MEFSATKENIEWLKKCAVGVLSTPENALAVEEDLLSMGALDIYITPMGGRLVLLCFKTIEEMTTFISEAQEWLSKWFDSVSPWDFSHVSNERLVWIKCIGIPLQVWCHNFFSSLVCGFGSLVNTDRGTSEKRRLDTTRLLISTINAKTISCNITLNVNGSLFNVVIVEDLSRDCYLSPSFYQDKLPA